MQAQTGKILTEDEVKALSKHEQCDCHPLPGDTKVDTIRKLQNAATGDRKAALKSLGRKNNSGGWPGCTEKFVNKTEKRRKKDKMAKKSRKQQRQRK